MKLPDGYVTEHHWAWSMSDPAARSQEPSTWAWEELDGTYLLGDAAKEEAHSLEEILKGNILAGSTREAVDGMNNDLGVGSNRDKFGATSTLSRKSPGRRGQQSSGDVVRKDKELTVDADRSVQSQRQDYTRTDSESSIDQSEKERCDCTECKSRRWRGDSTTQQGQGVSIRDRLNGVSF
ncbi:hypothetical protein PV08_10113 [Exophiala spinifera]|uniref:Uncharacterized protein n=1 Tax=Exophiala spinifera TaxID=91928 RepID=A0A0D2BHH4_9EURO|nr:uncharacterized protein PV08_10113 [Exophiala spinifera]KIW10814.1 hypothetical protein PV08_10113 [Exophiala spinifera]